MTTNYIPATNNSQLEEYQRREELRADNILLDAVRHLRKLHPETPTAALQEIALHDPDVRRAYNKARRKVFSLGRTIRRRQHRAAASRSQK